MVEGNITNSNDYNSNNSNMINLDNESEAVTKNNLNSRRYIGPPVTPVKKFYEQKEEEIVPSIPPRPLMIAPKLPLRQNQTAKGRVPVSRTTSYPREDHIYTGLRPESTINTKFYTSDFIVKVLVNPPNQVIGLQHGRIIQLNLDKEGEEAAGPKEFNRQFYELLQVDTNLCLAFQDTGAVYKLTWDEVSMSLVLLVRDSVPRGTSKVLLRPEINEIWVVSVRETSILAVNKTDVALIRRVPTHFPQANNIYFLSPEELAVIQPDRAIQIYSVPRFGHTPALIAKIPSEIGDLVKIVKIPTKSTNSNFGSHSHSYAYGTIFNDGKMIIWKFNEKNEDSVEKITVPLTLFRIQVVHVAADSLLLWLGLSNGKLTILQIHDAEEQKIEIVCEAKSHPVAICKFVKIVGGGLVSIDTGGQFCTWDDNLTFYKHSKL